jgi:hypothetical protein
MRLHIKIISKILLGISLVIPLMAQSPEFEISQTKIGRIWGGIAANGDAATLDFRAGFFPGDYDVLQHRGQGSENYLGSGYRLAAAGWLGPDDSLHTAAVYGPRNDYMPFGKVTRPIISYTRYKYPVQTVNRQPVTLNDFATYDPSKLSNGTYDQLIESTYKNVLGVEVSRKMMFWSQNYNDNYVIIEVELTNVGVEKLDNTVFQDTLRNFYFAMNMGMANNYFSNGMTPAPTSNERPRYEFVWQHYYGARDGDSMRVFYFYNADDPTTPGDNMGSPAISQGGRLLNTHYTFYSVLHASEQPFTNPANDVNDPLQPKVTYIGTEARIPNPGTGQDPYGSKNYWAIRGGFSANNLMPGSYPGTFHMINNDELGSPNFSNFPGGTVQAINSKNFCSFGPYEFPPNHKIRIVYVVGISGIGMEKSAEVGRKWLNGTLENPSDMPDPNTGWLPSNFAFPNDATEMDKRKNRWVSMGKDSMMLTAWRAKWNFENNYQIPQAPPPPEYFHVSGSGDLGAIVIRWKNTEAENMSNFQGYSIMRRLTNQDTIAYSEIYSSGPDDKAFEHEFLDTTALPGVPYYYYIQSKALIDENDLTADPTTRGKMMYSSRLWVPNILFIYPPRLSSEDMSRIRIVPNPYNINDPLVKSKYADTDRRGLNFFNLPDIVTIKIYTENGDLIKTIEHDKALDRDGSNQWNMITDNQQVISSGVYIAVFQKPDGETSFQKFIVVR